MGDYHVRFYRRGMPFSPSKVYIEQKKTIFFPYQPNSSLFMLLTISLVLLLVHFVTLNGGHSAHPNPQTWHRPAQNLQVADTKPQRTRGLT